MKQPIIKLEEIIWEITSQCNNNCEYCGSKDSINDLHEHNEDKHIQQIADHIADYAAELDHTLSIDISGGDPLLLNLDIHKYIHQRMPENVVLKILINPKSLYNAGDDWDVLSLYSWIGISVNDLSELNYLKSVFDMFTSNLGKICAPINPLGGPMPITIITNFNLDNIWHYDQIEAFVSEKMLTWQVQYTMYNDNSEGKAIYAHPDGYKLLMDKLQASINYGRNIVIADNMNQGDCAAGQNSIGILWDGTVVPCLSMRSWTHDLMEVGNIRDTALCKIWEEGFGHLRACGFKCCKDVCNNPYIPPPILGNKIGILPNVTMTPVYSVSVPAPILPGSHIIAYAVQTHPSFDQPFVYGAFSGGLQGGKSSAIQNLVTNQGLNHIIGSITTDGPIKPEE